MAEVAVINRAAVPASPSMRNFICVSRLWFRLGRFLSATPSRDEEGYCHEDDGNAQKNRAHGIYLRRQRPARLVPDIEWQSGLARACHQLGDGEIVEGHDEGKRGSA